LYLIFVIKNLLFRFHTIHIAIIWYLQRNWKVFHRAWR